MDRSILSNRHHLAFATLVALLFSLVSLSVAADDGTLPTETSGETEELAAAELAIELPEPSEADQALQTRIATTFRAIEDLQNFTVDVRAGVVRLSGETSEVSDREIAEEIARRFDGVIYVRNAIVVHEPEVQEEVAEAPTEVADALPEDEATLKRLTGIFSQIRALERVEVEVIDGVVRLQGKSASSEARLQAGELARSMPGVVYVDNQITEATDVADRVSPTWDRIQSFVVDFVRRIPIFLLALFIIFLFWQLSRLLVVWNWPFKKMTDNVLARGLLKQFLRIIIVIGGLLIALDLLDATTVVGAVLGTAGVVGLALGFAFRDIAENYLASILLSWRRPFEANDFVELEGFSGRVIRLTMRETILMTSEGTHVRISNATVFKSNIVNVTRNPKRRFDFKIGVGNEEDLAQAMALGITTLKEMDGVIDDPRPIARVNELADSSVTLWFAGWVNQEEASFGKVKSEAIRRVKEAFDEADIDMPSPIYIIEMTEALPVHKPEQRLAKAAAELAIPEEEILDIAVDNYIERQVEEERQRSSEEDLLAKDSDKNKDKKKK